MSPSHQTLALAQSSFSFMTRMTRQEFKFVGMTNHQTNWNILFISLHSIFRRFMACDEKRGYKGELGTRKLFTLVI